MQWTWGAIFDVIATGSAHISLLGGWENEHAVRVWVSACARACVHGGVGTGGIHLPSLMPGLCVWVGAGVAVGGGGGGAEGAGGFALCASIEFAPSPQGAGPGRGEFNRNA